MVISPCFNISNFLIDFSKPILRSLLLWTGLLFFHFFSFLCRYDDYLVFSLISNLFSLIAYIALSLKVISYRYLNSPVFFACFNFFNNNT